MISKLEERRSEELLSRKGSQAKGWGTGSPAPTQLQCAGKPCCTCQAKQLSHNTNRLWKALSCLRK